MFLHIEACKLCTPTTQVARALEKSLTLLKAVRNGNLYVIIYIQDGTRAICPISLRDGLNVDGKYLEGK